MPNALALMAFKDLQPGPIKVLLPYVQLRLLALGLWSDFLGEFGQEDLSFGVGNRLADDAGLPVRSHSWNDALFCEAINGHAGRSPLSQLQLLDLFPSFVIVIDDDLIVKEVLGLKCVIVNSMISCRFCMLTSNCSSWVIRSILDISEDIRLEGLQVKKDGEHLVNL